VKKIFYLVILVPIGVLLIVLSVANRQPVTLRLDPFNEVNPALAATWPFFAFLFVALLIGMIIGAVLTWFSQGRNRAAARRNKAETQRWRQEAETQRKRADEIAANLSAAQPAGRTLPAQGEKAA
jgi:uncharacterized integral membrane protein